MSRSRRDRRARAVAFACLVLVAAGCKAHPEGIADLVGDGFSYVEFPGRRILDVGLTSYGTDVGRDGRPVVLGLSDAGDLMIGDFVAGSYCTIGPANSLGASYLYASANSDVERRVPFLRDVDAEGWGTLWFTTDDCTVQVQAASQAKLLRFATKLEPPRLLALSRLQTDPDAPWMNLLVCDPATDKQPCKTLATVKEIRYLGARLWTIELDAEVPRLVARNAALEQVQKLGDDVTSFALAPNDELAAYTDSLGLHLRSTEGTLVTERLVDGCELGPAFSYPYRNLGYTYRTPCVNGSLVLYSCELTQDFELAPKATAPVLLIKKAADVEVALYLTASTALVEPPDANLWPSLAASFGEYFGQAAPPLVGRLTATTLGGETVPGPSNVWLGGVTQSYGMGFRVLADFDGSTGTLVDWNLNDGSQTSVAQGVEDFSWNWAIVRGVTQNKRFVEARADSSTSPVLDNVWDRGRVYYDHCTEGSIDCLMSQFDDEPPERRAILNDVGTSGGKLWLLDREQTRSFGVPEFLDDSVHPYRYGFLYRGDAVLYLRNFDQAVGTGTLTARFVKTLDPFTVSHVQHWREVSGDVPGIVYVTRRGSKAGLWFAALR